MSVNESSKTGFNYSLLELSNAKLQTSLSKLNQAGDASADSFSTTLKVSMANLQSQTIGMLTGSALGTDKADDPNSLGALLASLEASSTSQASKAAESAQVNGLSATGRNTALFDPESAYNMMSLINNNDVIYKAQFSQLNEMKSYLSGMQVNGKSLGNISASTSNDDIKTQLQNFASQYNEWRQHFDEEMQSDGLLAGTQAAQVARYELDQSIKNIFNGAADGIRGLSDLGFSIDPNTKLATFDSAKLDSVLASNKTGAVNALQQFSANFARSAELLISKGNFILNRLDNLDRVIDYFADNKTALQAEFGLGDPVKPTGQVAKALASYNQTYGILENAV
ncbi:MAG: hypothetical protein H6R18_1978 [Proteobacteria bacterium]|nr:hypothetical protein [Pseudomonadota bacterium]